MMVEVVFCVEAVTALHRTRAPVEVFQTVVALVLACPALAQGICGLVLEEREERMAANKQKGDLL